jgi:quercetin dioxygenase-like cupin family protein
MVKHKLDDFFKGWILGNFEPALHFTTDFEIAIKYYAAGDKEEKHYHKLATEYTAIVYGRVKMNGIEYTKGDIIEIAKNEATNFEVIEDTATVVVKLPSAKNDKYLSND